jgi:hypothetical protein
VNKAKAGGERQDQQEYDAIAIGGPPGCERTDGLIKRDSLDGVQYNAPSRTLLNPSAVDRSGSCA